MTSPYERRLRVIEGLLQQTTATTTDHARLARALTAGVLIGMHACPDRGEGEDPFASFARLLERTADKDDPRTVDRLMDAMLTQLGVAGSPTAEVLARMQDLLDAVPERWRGVWAERESKWWPSRAIEMWGEEPDGGGEAVAA
jgi:hypothetical protein